MFSDVIVSAFGRENAAKIRSHKIISIRLGRRRIGNGLEMDARILSLNILFSFSGLNHRSLISSSVKFWISAKIEAFQKVTLFGKVVKEFRNSQTLGKRIKPTFFAFLVH